MDYPTIVTLTLALILILALLIIGGLVLSARAFTQLVELTRFIGSQVVQNKQDILHLRTGSSQEMEKHLKSHQMDTTPTTQAHHD